MTRIGNDERSRIFGQPCTSTNMTVVTTPWGIKVQAHRLIIPVFLDACRAAYSLAWKPLRIDSYNCRKIRGSDAYSIHAWALAWDFFATPPNVPPPGGVWTPDNPVPPQFARCFTARGFTWGANFSRKDEPHIEWDGGRPPLKPAPAPNPEEIALRVPNYFKTLVAPNGGWWHAAADGGVFATHNGAGSPSAPYKGSIPGSGGLPSGSEVVDFVLHGDGDGYAFVVRQADGNITGYHYP